MTLKIIRLIPLLLLCAISTRAVDPINTCHGNTGTGVGTSVTCSTTITPTGAGHFFVGFFYTFGQPSTLAFTPSDTDGTSWTAEPGSTCSALSTAQCVRSYCTQINSTNTQTFSAGMNQPATSVAMDILEYAGISSCTLDNAQATGSTGNVTGPVGVSAGSVTTTQRDRAISAIFTCTLSDTSVNSAGTGWTKQVANQWNATGGGGCVGNLEVEDRLGQGTFTGDWTVNASTGTTFACGGSTNRACWVAIVLLFPTPSSTFHHSTFMKYRKLPWAWDNRRRKLVTI